MASWSFLLAGWRLLFPDSNLCSIKGSSHCPLFLIAYKGPLRALGGPLGSLKGPLKALMGSLEALKKPLRALKGPLKTLFQQKTRNRLG